MLLNEILYIDESFKLFKDATFKQEPSMDKHTYSITIDLFKTAVSKGFLKGEEKDINYWRKLGFNKLYDKLYDIDTHISNRQSKSLARKANIIEVTETSNYNIIIPLTPEAAQLHGAGTKWCIASKDPSTRDDYFNTYNAKGSMIVIFLPKHKDLEKLAAVIYNDKYHTIDSRDKHVDASYFTFWVGRDINKIIDIARTHMQEKDEYREANLCLTGKYT